MSRVAAATLAAALLAPLPAQEAGDSVADALDLVTPDLLAQSVTALDPQVVQLEENITPVESRSTDGEETVISLASDVLFDFGEAEVSGAAEAKIADLVADVPDGAVVQVHGHTDSIGGPQDNQELSERRADTVAEIVSGSRPDLQLEVEGFGEDEPVAPNEEGGEDNPEGRALNRRVEIRFDG
ncbi:OmpA family protein [Serinicoccus kebangsaanensis]|uniref:OmpA family protein n=1 Tax=Serinicoccus kebangsaanensis TaxID=2602069 RepID=UPI00178C2613|nr:OmpA family protein [Serinicoccus kebangsaanensis]